MAMCSNRTPEPRPQFCLCKDNSGDKIYVKDPVTGENVLDHHGHLIVDHDLYSHEGLTPDGIAEAFIEFAKKEGLSFFR